MATSQHSIRFPNETPSYRDARNELLEAEIALRKNIENVAALRRKLPLGGPPPEDYVFEEGAADINDSQTVRTTRLSELFDPGKNTLAVYSYMFGPNMKSACTSCTSILDGLNGTAPHARNRINFVVVAKSPLARIRELARGRGWNNLRLLSFSQQQLQPRLPGREREGWPTAVAQHFARRNGKIHHFYHTELLFAPQEPGMDGRHVDLLWPLWNLFDYTPEGRGTDWYPKLSY
jgi:predicted dithiol-disulfide oxidoreductase (DUF899 family)